MAKLLASIWTSNGLMKFRNPNIGETKIYSSSPQIPSIVPPSIRRITFFKGG
jgi:hypothetical protein